MVELPEEALLEDEDALALEAAADDDDESTGLEPEELPPVVQVSLLPLPPELEPEPEPDDEPTEMGVGLVLAMLLDVADTDDVAGLETGTLEGA